jgi:uncharacterized protein (DUF169 family)
LNDDRRCDNMDKKMRDRFVSQWRKYFGAAELPFAFFYSDECPPKAVTSPESDRCILSALSLVREGRTLCLSAESRMCGGAKRYLGFAEDSGLRDLAYFLSYGIPGKVKGERYKKSPELVRESEKYSPPVKAPKPFIVFKRWDKLSASDEPEVVVFIDGLDVIAGLFTLANYDQAEPNGVICPFASGCSSIVYHPYRELRSRRPRCILGMFDISARPFVGENVLSFAIPYPKFERMVKNMGESFLTTGSWKELKRRR